jgi:hypothetical protein
MGSPGLEHLRSSAGNAVGCAGGGAESGAPCADGPLDPNLALVMAGWHAVPTAMKAGIVAMVLAAGQSNS